MDGSTTTARHTPHPAVPVYVMLPLGAIHPVSLTVSDPLALKEQLVCLREAGVVGVSVDVWWGLVEQTPRHYTWEPYLSLLHAIRECGLKAACIASFHACGGNVGDDVNIPLPAWVLASVTPSMWYTASSGAENKEYISCWADHAVIVTPHAGRLRRTVMQCYEEFLASFVKVASQYFDDGTVSHLIPGAGPCGELRFPSYVPGEGWHYPGVGSFQCFSQAALLDLKTTAAREGLPLAWGVPPPQAASGSQNDFPDAAPFFCTRSGASSHRSRRRKAGSSIALTSPREVNASSRVSDTPRGAFFLRWYSDALLRHAADLLDAAVRALSCLVTSGRTSNSTSLVVKVPGIHWWAGHPSRAAEATAGLYAPPQPHSFYARLCTLLARYDAVLDFTCLEMRDAAALHRDPVPCCSTPFTLAREVLAAAACAGVKASGENALAIAGTAGAEQSYKTVVQQAQWCATLGLPATLPVRAVRRHTPSTRHAALQSPAAATPSYALESFTYLRLSNALMEPQRGRGWAYMPAWVQKAVCCGRASRTRQLHPGAVPSPTFVDFVAHMGRPQ